MGFCHNCGSKLNDNAVFCTQCGEKQGGVIMEKRCIETASVTSDFTSKTTTKKLIRTMIILLFALFFLIVLKFLLSFWQNKIFYSSEADYTISTPRLFIKNGKTYTLIDDEVVKISNELLIPAIVQDHMKSYKGWEETSIETKKYILIYTEDKTLYIYLKTQDKLLELEDVHSYKFSYNLENIALLSDECLYFGKLEALEDLDEIAKDIVAFDAFNDLSELFIINKKDVLYSIDGTGDKTKLKEKDVTQIATAGTKYLSYVKDTELLICDYPTEKVVYKDDFEIGEFHLFTMRQIAQDQSFALLCPTESYLFTEDNVEKCGFSFSVTLWGYDPSLYSTKWHVMVSHIPTVVLLNEFKTYVDMQKMTLEDSEFIWSNKNRLFVGDEFSLEVIDTHEYKRLNKYDIDDFKSDDKFEMPKTYCISDNEIYVLTKNMLYHCKDNHVEALEINIENFYYTQTIYNQDDIVTLYLIDEDKILMPKKNKIKTIYDGENVKSTYYIVNFKYSDSMAFYTEDDTLYHVVDDKVTAIAKNVENVYESTQIGLSYIVDDRLYYYCDGKEIEIGKNLMSSRIDII